jgi:hypothetical protein
VAAEVHPFLASAVVEERPCLALAGVVEHPGWALAVVAEHCSSGTVAVEARLQLALAEQVVAKRNGLVQENPSQKPGCPWRKVDAAAPLCRKE